MAQPYAEYNQSKFIILKCSESKTQKCDVCSFAEWCVDDTGMIYLGVFHMYLMSNLIYHGKNLRWMVRPLCKITAREKSSPTVKGLKTELFFTIGSDGSPMERSQKEN